MGVCLHGGFYPTIEIASVQGWGKLIIKEVNFLSWGRVHGPSRGLSLINEIHIIFKLSEHRTKEKKLIDLERSPM